MQFYVQKIETLIQIAAESGLGNPVTFIAWKSDHVVRSDVDGNINVWEVKVRRQVRYGIF